MSKNNKSTSVFKRKDSDDNNLYKYLWRVGNAIENGTAGFTWSEATPYINAEWHENKDDYYTSSAYRKPTQYAISFYDNVFSTMSDPGFEEMVELKEEIRKEKQKLFDERTALNKKLREQGRIEYMSDIIERTISEHCVVNLDSDRPLPDRDSAAIIHLTDVHCGLNVDNPINVFNTDVLKKRMEIYLSNIKKIQDNNGSDEAHIIIGGDLIAGLIHVNSRIEAKENVIEQVLTATDIIQEFIKNVYEMFPEVHVYAVAGNHGRSTANKEEAIGGENFDVLIYNILKRTMGGNDDLHFHDNELMPDIAAFRVKGHMIYATHGDKDTPTNVVDHMNQIAKKVGYDTPDVCYLGHRHKNGMNTIGVVKVIESGCVGGVDSYAIDKRFAGLPEQTVTIVTEDNAVEAVYNIKLDTY